MRSTRHPRPQQRKLPAALAALLLLGISGLAGAQSLSELYEAARAFDATYMAARSAAESAEYRAALIPVLAARAVG